MKPAGVRKLAFEHNLVTYAKKLKCWSAEEREKLDRPDLTVNPFTRFFTLKGVKGRLHMDVSDEDGTFTTSIPKAAFDTLMEKLAREFLIGGPGTLDTRATADQVFEKMFKDDPGLEASFVIRMDKPADPPPRAGEGATRGGSAPPPSSGGGDTGKPGKGGSAPAPSPPLDAPEPGKRHTVQPLKPHEFFKGLDTTCTDDRVKALVKEIRDIDYKKSPIAATFLFRALIESVLNWCIDHKGLRKDFNKSLSTQGIARPDKDPGLDAILKFVGKNETQIFSEPRIKSVLAHWSQQKQPMDMIVHGRWMAADATTLQQAAATCRPLLQKILDGSAIL